MNDTIKSHTTMNGFPEQPDRRMPYEVTEATFEAMHARIRTRIASRPETETIPLRSAARPPLRRSWHRWGVAAAAAAILTAGVVTTLRLLQQPAEPRPTLDELLSTASAETLRQAVAANYDDILYNQPL